LQRYQGGPQPTDSGEVSFGATSGSTRACWRKSQEDDFLYRILFERAADGMLLVTGEESILAANTQACHILKRSREEISLAGLGALFDPEGPSLETARRGWRQYGSFTGELSLVRGNKEVFPAELVVAACEDGGREIMSVVFRDITGRKRMQEKSKHIMNALVALHEAGRVLTSTLELEQIGKRFLEVVRRVAGFDAMVLHLQTDDGGLRVLCAFGPDRLRQEASGSPEAYAARCATLETKDSRVFRLRGAERRSCSLAGFCLPLLIQERIIGLLEAYGAAVTREPLTIETLKSLASQAASALENARLYRKVAERESRLEELVGKLLVSQEQERRRMAREVHDGLTQVAISSHQTLQAFADDYPPNTPAGAERLNRVLELARETVREARYVIADLRPTVLDDFGLAAALRLNVERLRADGWEITYDEALGEKRLPPDLETALYRVAQEALTNLRKHALTKTNAHVLLIRRDNNIRLEVRDGGSGFAPREVSERGEAGECVGLSSMQERIALIGGRFQIYSRPEGGTSVAAEVPLRESGEVGS
jgi:PAS domain S-box-containing protein